MLRYVILLSVVLSSCVGQFRFMRGNIEEMAVKMSKATPTNGKTWVLLIAGSKGYENYRHQADVCHAYHVVASHGIPDSQIVVMMYDDIANNAANPVKGNIINRPNGPNVYPGVPKDYTGEDVSKENFIRVLTGKSGLMKNVGSGKVIASGPNDNIFIFYSDHGGPGVLGMPSGRMYKDDLLNAIKQMHTNNKYHQMVVYIEACYSGSLFYENLPTDLNVFATTAANRSQSSYACYVDYGRWAYLGDEYSVAWMEDSDAKDLRTETLTQQYGQVKNRVKWSVVKEFGNMAMASQSVGSFQGSAAKVRLEYQPLMHIRDAVPSPDVKLHLLYNKIKRSTSAEEQNRLGKELNEEYKLRDDLALTFKEIAEISSQGQDSVTAKAMYATPQLKDMSCYKTAVEWFHNVCYNLNESQFAYTKLYVLANLCDAGVPTNTIVSSISQTCK